MQAQNIKNRQLCSIGFSGLQEARFECREAGNRKPPFYVFCAMKMVTWRHLIRATSDRIADSERRIERQRQMIADLAQAGDDTVLAERELAALIQGNEQLKESRARLLEGFQEHCTPNALQDGPTDSSPQQA